MFYCLEFATGPKGRSCVSPPTPSSRTDGLRLGQDLEESVFPRRENVLYLNSLRSQRKVTIAAHNLNLASAFLLFWV